MLLFWTPLPSTTRVHSVRIHIRISGAICLTRHIRGTFTFHRVIFKSYSTVVYFSDASERSLVIWFCKSSFPYPDDVKESSKWILVQHMWPGGTEEMTSL
jgi:hypothetical protein